MEMQPTTAVIFASGFTGTTKKTGKYIAKTLDADIFDLKKQTAIDISGYKKIIFGTGVHVGKPYSKLVNFLTVNKDKIAEKSIALYICCMYDEDKGRDQCTKISNMLGIPNGVFFSGKSEKNEVGFEKIVDDFIAKQRAQS